MKKVVIPVAFGALDITTFNKSYRPLFSLLESADIRPAFLNAGASQICGVPLFENVLKNIETDASIEVFPLILNYGREYSQVLDQCRNYKAEVSSPLLESMRNEVAASISKHCTNPNTSYLILGHGSSCAPDDLYNQIMERLPGNTGLFLHHSEKKIIDKAITTVPLMLVCGRHIAAMNSELSQTNKVTHVCGGLLDDTVFRIQVAERIRRGL